MENHGLEPYIMLKEEDKHFTLFFTLMDLELLEFKIQDVRKAHNMDANPLKVYLKQKETIESANLLMKAISLKFKIQSQISYCYN